MSVPGSAATAKASHCYDFAWQQDAQVAYLANLSDPWGLDAAVGANDGDGLACTGLPVDPNRAASKPIGAYVPPPATAALKSALVAPALDYYGVAQDGLPGDSKMFDDLATEVGKAPSSVGWFSGWDSPYGATQVEAAWSRGSMPVITWMSKATLPGSTRPDTDFSFSNILAGDFDSYLYQYAGDVVRTNLPVVIRFDHEMNGNWYPWGAGAYNNTPAQFKAVWQHVWNIFQQVGANEQAIWLYAPARVDNLNPHGSSATAQQQTTIAETYPGDQYVDLIGATVYMRTVAQGASFSVAFGKTLDQLKAVSDKSIFLPEIGAIETGNGGADVAALKAQWTTNALAGILADPRIIGFLWFNNVATVGGVDAVTNDWRLNSSPTALAAFRTGVADPRFSSGVMPDLG